MTLFMNRPEFLNYVFIFGAMEIFCAGQISRYMVLYIMQEEIKMNTMSKNILRFIVVCIISPGLLYSCKQPNASKSGTDYLTQGTPVPFNKDMSLVYDFNRNPAIGMLVVRIKVTDSGNNPVKNLRITGNSGMPSMKGAHDTGEVEFRINKEGVYLLPVNIVMPGDWEIEVIIYRDKDRLFKGRIGFNV